MMVVTYSSFPAFELMFDTGGHPVDATVQTSFLDWLVSPDGLPITDVVLISHGWNNDIDDARALYQNFFQAMTTVITSQPVAVRRRFAIGAIFWPSKKFADSDLIPGGAAAVASSLADQLDAQLDQLKVTLAGDPTAAAKIEHARDQIANLDLSQSAQDDFVFALVNALPAPRNEKDEGLDDAMTKLKSGSLPGNVVLQRLSVPMFPTFPLPAGTETHALGLGGLLGGITAGASKLVNYFTYYLMKDRASIVGRSGVHDIVLALQNLAAKRSALRIHLIGHSFGGRLVTATANSLTTPKSIASMLLLEAAYSHNGLAKNWDEQGHDGAFRGVVTLPVIAGETQITHSVHDTAVGTAYPLASRIMHQTASALGDANDPFGGMGRNGAQHTPEAIDDQLAPVGHQYSALPEGKTIRNLSGDGPDPIITSHGDVAKPEIVWAWLSRLTD
jgi:pimeloyl-ACP methyl ester carboxylesterase